MEVKEMRKTVRDVYEGYSNDAEEGVTAYNGKLDIRPKYQREFVYNDEQKQNVIRSVLHDMPLNVMYWVDREDGTFEVLDGQQRTLSLCEYIAGAYSYENKYFDNLTGDEQEKILNYELFIYVCKGKESEKLDWFKIVNIAGERLTDQELRNAVYAGPWVESAKKYFSKTGCPAYQIGGDYLKGSSIRQDYLETALKWICDRDGLGEIEQYMAKHSKDDNIEDLRGYFEKVIAWVKKIFKKYRSEMKGLPWGIYYNKYKDKELCPEKLEEQIQKLMADDDVTKKSGVYEYLLNGNESTLNIRAFDKRDRRAAYERQHGKCAICNKKFEFNEMHADHIKPWSKGGRTVPDNCQMLCTKCNLKKSNM